MGEPRDQNRFLVRMPEGMRDRIADAAKANGRSMNSEIVARLESSFDPPKPPRLTEEEKEEIWEYLQQKASAEKH